MTHDITRAKTIADWSAEAGLAFNDYLTGTWDGKAETLPEAIKRAAALLAKHPFALHEDDEITRPIVAGAIFVARSYDAAKVADAAKFVADRQEQSCNERLVIKAGWEGAGQRGRRLGPDVDLGQPWTPVLWDGEEDPDFHKEAGLAAE